MSRPERATEVDQGSENLVPVVRRPLAAVPTAHRSGVGQVGRDPFQSAEGVQCADGGYAVIENRLRQLGATYYRLEQWGGRGQLYRFQCKVAVDGNRNFTSYFEASARDPLEAMQQVLAQVEAWRTRRVAWSQNP